MSKNRTEKNKIEMKGALPYRFTNDYLFRATLQTSEIALRGLVCALLGLSAEEIRECAIENPIELGDTIDEKTYVLDVKILLNNQKRLNIELQVEDEGNWPERSLLYLCRSFDELPAGASYAEVKTTIHIGILDFQLFPDEGEFYSEYKMMNVKTGKVYSDKFILRVLELTQIENVPEEERNMELYYWACLFKATSWEEVIRLAQKSEIIEETASTIKKLTAEEKIRLQCEARERYERDRISLLAYAKKIVEDGRREAIEEGKKEGIEQGKAFGIIEMLKKYKEPDGNILNELVNNLAISTEKAKKYMERFAEEENM